MGIKLRTKVDHTDGGSVHDAWHDAFVAHAQRQAAAELFKGTDMMEEFDARVATILRDDFGIEE